eukprot:807541-Rhodomonas_salina.1
MSCPCSTKPCTDPAWRCPPDRYNQSVFSSMCIPAPQSPGGPAPASGTLFHGRRCAHAPSRTQPAVSPVRSRDQSVSSARGTHSPSR